MKKYENVSSHLETLKKAPGEDLHNEFIISGIIDKFSIQFELGRKVFKELLLQEGDSAGKTGSPRDIIKAAYKYYSFMDEEVWLKMLRDRNNTTHIYDGDEAVKLVHRILEEYIPAFVRTDQGLRERYGEMLWK